MRCSDMEQEILVLFSPSLTTYTESGLSQNNTFLMTCRVITWPVSFLLVIIGKLFQIDATLQIKALD